VNHFKKIKKMPLYRETEEFSIFSMYLMTHFLVKIKLFTNQVQIDKKIIERTSTADQKRSLIMRMYQACEFSRRYLK
jgi:RNA polymerase sigma-70 factor (ECF subfamily)